MSFYNESKFNMWRACIGVIWIDGKLADEEERWISEKIRNLKFTPEQKEILLGDLKNNINFEEVFLKISDKRDKAFLAHQMRVIGHLDKDFSTNEKNLFEQWNKFVLGQVDLEGLETLIGELERESYHEDEVYKVDNKGSVFEKAHMSFMKLYNKGDYKFPKD